MHHQNNSFELCDYLSCVKICSPILLVLVGRTVNPNILVDLTFLQIALFHSINSVIRVMCISVSFLGVDEAIHGGMKNLDAMFFVCVDPYYYVRSIIL